MKQMKQMKQGKGTKPAHVSSCHRRISFTSPREVPNFWAGRICRISTQIARLIVRPKRQKIVLLFKGQKGWHNPIDPKAPGIWNWDEASDLPGRQRRWSWRNVREDSGLGNREGVSLLLRIGW